MADQLRLMAVHAHPDDESSKGAATMARYVAEGVDVLVVTCTGGERGSVLNPKMDRPEVWENIAEIRRHEMDRARDILGVRQTWLGFVDSGLPEGDPLPPLPEGCFAVQDVAVAAGPLVAQIRQFRPQVVLTYDEDGGYPHPDHIMTHKISMVAFDAAGDPLRYPEAGEPWQPSKLYYHMWGRGRWIALHEGMLAAGMESPFVEMMEHIDRWPKKDHRITTRVECADYFETRDDALRAHATQVDPDGFWFRAPLSLQQRVWPTEDYELVRSEIDTKSGNAESIDTESVTAESVTAESPEDDLFAGVREAVSAGVGCNRQ